MRTSLVTAAVLAGPCAEAFVSPRHAPLHSVASPAAGAPATPPWATVVDGGLARRRHCRSRLCRMSAPAATSQQGAAEGGAASNLKPGQRVMLKGLVGGAVHNGKMGVITKGVDAASGRAMVEVTGETKPMLLKPVNLQVSARTP